MTAYTFIFRTACSVSIYVYRYMADIYFLYYTYIYHSKI